ncbi:hypothetical protein SLA2020_261560 [Shorea laevis]
MVLFPLAYTSSLRKWWSTRMKGSPRSYSLWPIEVARGNGGLLEWKGSSAHRPKNLARQTTCIPNILSHAGRPRRCHPHKEKSCPPSTRRGKANNQIPALKSMPKIKEITS